MTTSKTDTIPSETQDDTNREQAPPENSPDLVPEVVEIRLDFTKDAIQLGRGGCRKWK